MANNNAKNESMSVQEAGRRGGKATSESHDHKFYEEIGSKGGHASSGSFEKGSQRARSAGKSGGDATNQAHGKEYYEEIGSHQGKENNPGNFANRPKSDAQEAGHRGGTASAQTRRDQ
jgi:general stress protein YciG